MEDTMALIPQSRDTLSHRMGEGGPSPGYGPARRGEGIVYPILRTPQYPHSSPTGAESGSNGVSGSKGNIGLRRRV